MAGTPRIDQHGERPRCSHVFTIDVEEYFHIEAARGSVTPRDWLAMESRVESQMDHLLGVLAEHEVTATLFVLGWIAQRHRDRVKRWHAAGHEIASHGMFHQRLLHMSRKQQHQELRQSRMLLEDIIGDAVLGFRAPTWSVTRANLERLDTIAEAGFVYDSSIFPVRHPQYGLPDAPIMPHHVGGVFEIPPLVWRVGSRRLAAAGGGYFRHLPLGLMRLAMRQAEREHRPAVLYFHPWEFDADLPRMALPRLQRVRTYAGLKRSTARLRRLLRRFPTGWGTMRDLVPAAVEARPRLAQTGSS